MSDLTDGCSVCNVPYPEHGKRVDESVGLHGWRAPSALTIITRMARESALVLSDLNFGSEPLGDSAT